MLKPFFFLFVAVHLGLLDLSIKQFGDVSVAGWLGEVHQLADGPLEAASRQGRPDPGGGQRGKTEPDPDRVQKASSCC